MSLSTEQYMALSAAAYGDFTNADEGKKLNQLLQKIPAAYDPEGASLHDSLSNWTLLSHQPNTPSGFCGSAFQSPTGEIVFTFRGTEPLTLSDIMTDAQIAGAMGDLPSQFGEALSFVNSVTGGDYSNISFTGHSLGGGISHYLSLVTRQSSVTFNAVGIGQIPIVQQLDHTGIDLLVTDHTNVNDTIGNFGIPVGTTIGHSSVYGDVSILDVTNASIVMSSPYSTAEERLQASQTIALGIAAGIMTPEDFITGSIPLKNHGLGSIISNGQMTSERNVEISDNIIIQVTSGFWDAADGGKFTTFTAGGVVGGLVYYSAEGLVRIINLTGGSIAEIAYNGADGVLKFLDTTANLIDAGVYYGYYELAEAFDNTIKFAADTVATGIDYFDNIVLGMTGHKPIGLIVNGTDGDDTIDGSIYDDTLIGGAGDDYIFASAGDDFLSGGDGDDTLDGVSGSDVMYGGAGNDILYGVDNVFNDPADSSDYLDGGAGDDELMGGIGGDTYVFARGYGNDNIWDHSDWSDTNSTDRVVFGENIQIDDLLFRRNHDELHISIKGTDDTLTISRFFSGHYGLDDTDTIERFEFTDGTYLTATSVLDICMQGTDADDYLAGTHLGSTIFGGAGNDSIYAGNGNDNIYGETGDDIIFTNYGDDYIDGGEGDDEIYAGDGNDTILGGNGRDIMLGEYGNDEYIVGTNTGYDLIVDSDGQNILNFGDTISWQDIIARQSAHSPNLLISVRNVLTTILIDDYFSRSGDFTPGISASFDFMFNDGIARNFAEIVQNIHETDSDLTPIYMSGDDWAFDDHNYFLVGDNNDQYVTGRDGDDILNGKGGNDRLIGNSGSDTYVLALDGGIDYVNDEFISGDITTIQVESGVYPEDISIIIIDNELRICIKETGDEIRLENSPLTGNSTLIRDDAPLRLQFAETGDIWDVPYMNSLLTSDSFPESTIEGTVDSDHLSGTDNNDIIDGLGGDDYLSGGKGDDTYVFGPGYGSLTIDDSDWESNSDDQNDTLIFLPGISSADIEISRDYSDLKMQVVGTSDSITIYNQFSWDGYAASSGTIEHFVFSDGTIWDQAYLYDYLNNPTENSDILIGTAGNDMISGLAGDDTIWGQAGNDTLDGGAGDDELYGGSGNDTFVFGRGYDWDMLYTLDSEPGDVSKVVFKAGVSPYDLRLVKNESDLIAFIREEVDVCQISDFYAYDGYDASTIQSFEFADGTIWDRSTIDNIVTAGGHYDQLADPTIQHDIIGSDQDDNILTDDTRANVVYGRSGDDRIHGGMLDDVLYGESGDDNIYGNNGNDFIDGGAGDDSLAGGSGSDIYYFDRGYGWDTVSEWEGDPLDNDTVLLGSGLSMSDIIFNRLGDQFDIAIADTDDILTNYSQFLNDDSTRLESVQTADGYVISDSSIEQLIQAMASWSNDSGMSWSQGLASNPQDVQSIVSQYWTAPTV